MNISPAAVYRQVSVFDYSGGKPGGNRTTRQQTNSRSVKSRTGQLAEMFDLKCGVYNSSKYYFGQITLFIRCQYLIGLELEIGLGLMYK